MAITLEELLRSRDERAALQQSFLREHPEGTLLCLTVQLPGEVKRDERSLRVAEAAVEALREMFPERSFELLRDLPTGFEGYFVVPLEPLDAKRAAIGIEDEHPLGRLMDIDVITADGPVSRSAVGAPERRCLICSQPARYCMRARSHSPEELLAAIDRLLA
ncbi:MAG: citrate lyase holo-[acyl-carrier protein] synthase [Bacteroidales bacterium]|nr:citrate lyase holo-[acyl-carrier protein] synthase [Bacteroidales bacterium]